MASIIDDYCDLILVGDSVANVIYGMKNTHNINIDTIINHGKAVRLGVKKSILVVDMPKGSYNNIQQAKRNAKFIIRKTKCDAVKIENNKKNFKIIKELVKDNIMVMGHIGYTPQFNKKFRVHGSSIKEEKKLIQEAKIVQKAGAFSIVLECIKGVVAKKITKELRIPTIGIGSSFNCDGQILVTEDILGMSGFYPKFVKKYVNLNNLIKKSIKKFNKDVKKSLFPRKKHSF